MILYPNIWKHGPEHRTDRFTLTPGESWMPPAKIDEILLEAFDALEQTQKLHETTPNPETKRQTKRIFTTLHSSLIQLAPLGIHSVGRLERLPVSP